MHRCWIIPADTTAVKSAATHVITHPSILSTHTVPTMSRYNKRMERWTGRLPNQLDQVGTRFVLALILVPG